MPTSTRQDRDFIADVIPNTLLEISIEWIQANLTPEDVFTAEQLREWAKANDMQDIERGE